MAGAWKDVRVTAVCPRCEGEGDVPFTAHYPCGECRKTGRVSVPVSEWAAALATVPEVEQIKVRADSDGWWVGALSVSQEDLARHVGFDVRTAIVLPSSRETGGQET